MSASETTEAADSFVSAKEGVAEKKDASSEGTVQPREIEKNAREPLLKESGSPDRTTDALGHTWVKLPANEGRSYYYCAALKETKWDNPQMSIGGCAPLMQHLPPVGLQRPPFLMQRPPMAPIPGLPLPLAPVWSIHGLPDGRLYYFNRISQQSVWERPDDVNAMAPVPPSTLNLLPNPSPFAQQPQVNPEEKEKEKEKQARPIASRPIPGKSWHIVFTGDEKVFFFNKVTRVSVWEVPRELSDVPNLEKLMRPPRHEDEAESENGDGEEEDEAEAAGVGEKVEVEEPEAKKPKLEDGEESAEQKANRLRNTLSVEEKQELMFQMLAERNVSAFSAFEKELPKFMTDYRYLLLPNKDRRTVFDNYVMTRVEEEKKEKNRKIKEKRDDFRKVLEEAHLGPKSTFSEFSAKYCRHDRFKAVDKMKEREALFSEFLTQLKSKQKEEESAKEEKVKTDFFAMLAEGKGVSSRTDWQKLKESLHKDKRYRAVNGSEKREKLFKEFVSKLGDSRSQERERKEKMEASLRERQREVERERENQAKVWGRERQIHRKEETVERFMAFLIDMVKDSEKGWRETKHGLKKDHRWRDFDLLETGEKEELFYRHVSNLRSRKRHAFHQLLDETKISLTSTWKDIVGKIKEDPRFEKFSKSDSKREVEFERYMEDQLRKAKEDFKSLLRETKQISHRTKKQISETPSNLKEIKEVLKNDLRWLVLDFMDDAREDLLFRYIDELDSRGPPPPPTATDPSETRRKRTI